MKPIHLLSSLCLLMLLLQSKNLNAANNPTTWPYGGKEDSSEAPYHGLLPLYFSNPAEFRNAHFAKDAVFMHPKFTSDVNFEGTQFDEIARFEYPLFYGAAIFRNTQFRKSAQFWSAKFSQNTDFSSSHFSSDASFVRADFTDTSSGSGIVNFFGTEFAKNANFSSAFFRRKAWFMNAKFADDADFRDAKFITDVDFSHTAPEDYTTNPTIFKKQAIFKSVIFNGYTNFSLTQFAQNANFSNATFSRMANFSDATFSGYANFENCQFLDKVNFSGTQFIQGVDLRRADFNKTNSTLIDHHTFFPNGKLNVNWNQIKGRLHLSEESCINATPWQMAKREYRELDSLYNRVAHQNISDKPDTLAIKRQKVKARLESLTQAFDKERYELTEIFYTRLRDNYLAQNDKASADAVMYELAEHRADILKEPLWILYGWIMGWGYKPVQFLIAAFLLVALPFALFWYRRYYHLVLPLVDHAIDDEFEKQLKALEKLNKKNHFNHSTISSEIIFPARVWHVLFFSTSVLLGVRFKKEWIEKKNRAFLWWVTAEWLIGIGLYILFAVLVKSNEFSYIKGLLGL